MFKPVLSLQTVYFDESDETERDEARRLGADLYAKLTRPPGDPLAYGPGIPVQLGVHWKHVDPQSADATVLIPVLGANSYNLMASDVIAALVEWTKAGATVLPVPTSLNWRAAEPKLPGKQLLTMLYGKGDPRRRTLDELVLGTARIWEADRGKVRLFISHSKADLEPSGDAARRIHDYVVTDGTGQAFFDTNDLHPGESLVSQIDDAVSHGVLIAVRGDAFSSRVWCQKELLLAKMRELPTLSVEVLRRGEIRSSPYGGNAPSLVWDGNPAPVVSQALVEWLRAEYFRREARRIIEAANLPDDIAVLARPPELLDLAQGPLLGERAQLVLHPDPELSAIERRVLKSARPRLHLATPSTAFRRLLSRRDETADVSSPLEGMQIAMSLSDSPNVDGPEGYTKYHVEDATIHVARTLISSGGAIAYGGDFRPGGYTPMLAQLIQTYNQTASAEAQNLHSYLAAIIKPGDAPENTPLILHSLLASPDMAREAWLPKPTATAKNLPPAALYFSDMRRVMEKHVAARFILGGNAIPRLKDKGDGYGGRYPGLVEEAWRSLQAGNPLYVAGGFGGAAELVADLLTRKKRAAKLLLDKTWMANPYFKKNAAAIDRHPLRRKLGLPKRMEDLAAEIVRLGCPHLKNDAASLEWNGLSVEDNLLLFRTRDPVTLAALVLKGLLRVARKEVANKLQIELVFDSLTAADKLDAVAIATLDGVPLGGAGAALDNLTGGTASDARAKGEALVSLKESLIDADWLFLASLGKLGEAGGVLKGVEAAANQTAAQARQHGFQRLGVVTFGGNVLADPGVIARAMLKGFRKLPPDCVVVWYENDETRFQALAGVLGKLKTVKLSTRVSAAALAASPPTPEPLFLTVQLENLRLNSTFLPPSSSAVVATHGSILKPQELEKLSEGIGQNRQATPEQTTLDERGGFLAKRLFGPKAASILSKFGDSKLTIVHDTAASRVPFEMLLAQSGEAGLRPALRGGITRRLSIPGLDFERQFAKPPKKGKLKILLVANPNKGDPQWELPEAEEEAEEVKSILNCHKDKIELIELRGPAATVKQVTAALAGADILHYCGHAFFDGPEDYQSGLILAKKLRLTGVALTKVNPLPRMAFVNACQAGRVRGERQPESKAAAFAELFLRSGIDAYLGTFWEVGDLAARLFAGTVYTELAKGMTLEQAVLAGRKALFEKDEPDWANYMLFGGGNFRLVAK